ncbi:TPA: HD domain-containing protein [Candidatus Scatousia excrementigallinarum]|mgnify:CR=1 FL=1|uniref:HD domain-containing protein n=1 Tax=Candidatus Scatousia excrementigallinarum TaxID=2840935 RepID=A0A9D1F0R4_9BACT|nr:HD domain-containing protein [Candidatus Scatousia excrementigallinarum]
MKNKDVNSGVSLFGQSEYLMENDPIEEIFALNLGDFISEHLISEDLAKKIGSNVKDKKEGLKNQLRELISIYSLNNTLCVLNFDTKEDYAIYTSIAHSICRMLEIEKCNIYLSYEFAKGIDNDNDLVLVGTTMESLKCKGFNLDDNSIVSVAFREQDTITENHLTAVSMHCNSRNVGVIVLESPDDIQKEYLTLVESIANLFATSMTLQGEIDTTNKLIDDETSTVSDLQHERAELTALIGDLCDYQQEFVEHLANAVDAKGQYKVSHSKNTANLARQICRELGLNEKTTDLIYYAGLLQNIGKITLSEKIFATNGKLSPEDLKKIQNHSNIGVNLLMNINFLSEVVPYINYQKERVDGSGEPEGLKGQSIPLGSRIIAAADAYSAMTSDRPYRKAMPQDKAISIMKEEAGKKWDVDVVNALVQSLK